MVFEVQVVVRDIKWETEENSQDFYSSSDKYKDYRWSRHNW